MDGDRTLSLLLVALKAGYRARYLVFPDLLLALLDFPKSSFIHAMSYPRT